MKRAVYDRQIKTAAVKLAQESDKLYGESAFPGRGNALFNSTYEAKKLQKQIKELEMENEL